VELGLSDFYVEQWLLSGKQALTEISANGQTGSNIFVGEAGCAKRDAERTVVGLATNSIIALMMETR
jgi:hypothetical protein